MPHTASGDLIAAVYAATLTPEDFNSTFDTLDDILFADEGRPEDGVATLPPVVAPHIAIARDIQKRIGLAETHEQKLRAILDSVPNPSYLISRGERVLAANALAEARHRILPKTLKDCLADTDMRDQVRDFLARTSAEKIVAVAGGVGSRKAQPSVLVSQVDAALLGGELGPVFILSIVDFGFGDDVIAMFRDAYDLTQAEAQVALLLASGWRAADIAAERGVALDTVRTQIKIVKHKTSTPDIPALVRLLCGLAAGIHSPAVMRVRGGTPLKSRHVIALPDGRRLDYLDQGAPNGRPVLLFHNLPYGIELPQSAIAQAHRDGVRFIAPFRPGFAGSDGVPDRGIDALLTQVAEDSCALLEALNIPRAAVVSHAVGASYALRFARLFPDRVSRLVAVSRAPIWRDEWMRQTPQRQRFIMRLTRHAPALLPVVAWAMASCMNSRYANDFIVYNCKDGAADARAVENQETVDLIAKGSVEAAKNGIDAVCRECRLVLLDMTAEARETPHKFHILHGDDDRIIALAQSQAFVDEVPGATLEVVEDAGQLLFYSHWHRVLSAVKDA